MKSKSFSLLFAGWLVLSQTALAHGFESSDWSNSSNSFTAEHSGGDDHGAQSGTPGGTPAGTDQNQPQPSDSHADHGDGQQDHQQAAGDAGDTQANEHSVNGSVYNDVYDDHHGLVNALSHVKNPHAIAVLQAILNGLNPSPVAKSVYQTVSQTVYQNGDSTTVSGEVYSGGTGDESVGDDQEALTILEQDSEDNKTELSSAFSKMADLLMQHGDLTTSRRALEDSVSADPINTSSYEKLGQVLSQAGTTTINTYVNGKPSSFDVQPYMQNDRTLVPIRSISEALGAQVDWNDSTQTATITKNGHSIQLTIGNSQAIVDGQTVILDTPAELKDNRTFVPVRFLSEAFGANVQWFPVGQIVDITLQHELNK